MSCASMDDERCPAVIFGSVSASEARLITQHWKQVLSHSTAHITTDKDNLVCLYSIHSRNAHRFCPPAAGRTVTRCTPWGRPCYEAVCQRWHSSPLRLAMSAA
jgi:hypothetical protein